MVGIIGTIERILVAAAHDGSPQLDNLEERSQHAMIRLETGHRMAVTEVLTAAILLISGAGALLLVMAIVAMTKGSYTK